MILIRHLILSLFLSILTLPATRAQLVNDGETNVLDNTIVNVTGDIIVATNGSFTSLTLTNGATVSSSGNADLGLNNFARSNHIIVTGNGSAWQVANQFYVGESGSFNELDLVGGGTVTNSQTTIGYQILGGTNTIWISDTNSLWRCSALFAGYSGSGNQFVISNGATVSVRGSSMIGVSSAAGNNQVVVTDPGTLWTNTGSLWVGNGGSGNRLVISNGAAVYSASSLIGGGPSSAGNSALVTGPASAWYCGYLYLSYINSGMSQLTINNGAKLFGSSTMDVGAYANSNLLTVADSGSLLQCDNFRIGYSSTRNQCIVSNGAALTTTGTLYSVATIEGTFTTVTITGSGTVWSNAAEFHFGQYSNTLAVTAGARLIDTAGYLESGGAGKPNTVTLAGANSLWKNLSDFHVNDIGSRLFVTNGATLTDAAGYFGDDATASNNVAFVSGAGSCWSNSAYLYVGYNGSTNKLWITDTGRVYVGFQAYIGYNYNGNQIIVTNAGNLVVAGPLQIGSGGGNVSNALIVAGGNASISNATIINFGSLLILNSGTLWTRSLTANAGSRLIFRGGNLSANSSAVSPALAVGDGTNATTLVLATNSLGQTGTHSMAGGLTIANNAMLTGAGNVSGKVFVASGGTVWLGTFSSPASAINSLVLSNGSTIVMSLRADSESGYNIFGLTNIVYGGTLRLTNIAGTYAAGQSYQIFNSTHYSGAFTNIVPSVPGPKLNWDTSQLAVNGTLKIIRTPVTPTWIPGPGGGLNVTITNGTPGMIVHLITSTNLAAPFASWDIVTTNNCDSNGNATIFYPVTFSEEERYFDVKTP